MDPAPIARLRRVLADQVAAPLRVSATATQYEFSEESAAYNDIDVKHGDAFAIVVCQGSLPYDELVVSIWHRYADEVWLVDTSDQSIVVAPRHGAARVFATGERVQSSRLPGVAISVAAVFALTN